MGISFEEFCRMGFRELNNRIKGYEEKQESERHEKLYWLRWQTAYLVNVHLEKKNRIEPEQLIPLKGDKTSDAPTLSDEQIKKRLEKWDRKQTQENTVIVNSETVEKLISEIKIV